MIAPSSGSGWVPCYEERTLGAMSRSFSRERLYSERRQLVPGSLDDLRIGT